MFTLYDDMNSDEKCKNWDGFGGKGIGLTQHTANQCTKFKVSSFTHSKILSATKNLNGSRDHTHAPFRDELLSVGSD